jgi:hypothetical protein
MTPDAAPLLLVTVLAGDGGVIHLLAVDPVAQTPLTLCGLPSSGEVRARQFHRLGCMSCAVEALGQGVTAVKDSHHATLNLPRFVARRAATEAVPEQRGSAT